MDRLHVEPVAEFAEALEPGEAQPQVGIVDGVDVHLALRYDLSEVHEGIPDERHRRLGSEITPAFPGKGDELVSRSALAVRELVARPELEGDPGSLPLEEVKERVCIRPSPGIGDQAVTIVEGEVVTQPVLPFVVRAVREHGAVEEEEGRPVGLVVHRKHRAPLVGVDGDLFDRDSRHVPDEEEVAEFCNTLVQDTAKLGNDHETRHDGDSLSVVNGAKKLLHTSQQVRILLHK